MTLTKNLMVRDEISNQIIHVLCIDDDVSFASLTVDFLDKLFEGKIISEIIHSAKLAFSLLEKRQFDVIVSDYQMPDMNGLELLEELRKQGNQIPFILITGHSREDIAIQALNLGADYYLQKENDIFIMFQKLKHYILKVTEHKKVEKALHDSEARYRAFFDLSADGILLVDPETLKIVEFNKTAHHQLGYSRKEFSKLTIFDIESNKNSEETKKHIQSIAEGGKIFSDIITTHRTKFGDNRIVRVITESLEISKKTMIYCIFKDLTDKTIIAEKLIIKSHDLGERIKELNCLYKITEIMMDSSKPMIDIVFDIVENIIPPAWRYPEITCSRITIGGKKFQSGNFEETEWKQVADILIERKKLGSIEVFYLESKPEREEGPFLKEERDLINELANKIGFYYDRRQNLEQLIFQKQELSEFAHQIAHESRNSLLTIQGYSDLIKNDIDLSFAKKIKSISGDILKMHKNSVELADAGLVIEKKELVNLYDIILNVSSNVIPNNIRFSTTKLPTIYGDRHKLSQVFRNIFENAVIHGQPSKIEVIFHNPNLILVKNDGIRIPPPLKKIIFQQWFSTEKKGGLGLSIVKKIIEAHGWKISLKSDEETTFCIKLSI